jgi:DNA replication protein DnaC
MKECPLCGGSGWRPIEKDGLSAVERCECRRHDENWLMDRAMIPARHRQCDFAHFDALNDSLKFAKIKAQRFADYYPSVREGLLLLGDPGVGKTHLAIAVLKQLMFQKGIDALFCSYQDLFHRIRESYDRDSPRNESEVLGPVLNTELLLIDDLGANRFTEWSEDTITYVLNHRYNEKKATILTSNLPDRPETAQEESSRAAPSPEPPESRPAPFRYDEEQNSRAKPASDAPASFRQKSPSGKYNLTDSLTKRIGLRVRSRLYEMCDVVTIYADDFRQMVKAHRQ